MSTLLAGSTNSTFAHEYTITANAIVAAQFTPSVRGIVEELRMHTGIARSATQVLLGIYTDNAGTPGTVLGEAAIAPEGSVIPGHSWIGAPGLGVSLKEETPYWFAVLPLNGSLDLSISVASGGTALRAAVPETFSRLESTTWAAAENLGPIGFQAIGTQTTTLTQRLIKRMGTWNTGEKHGGKTDLERYLEAVAKPMEAVAEIAEESGEQGKAGWVPSYGVIFNPATCPAKFLPFLGQFVGVEVPKTATEAEARELIKVESGLSRGTLASLQAAIKMVLGASFFFVQERTSKAGSEAAYHVNILVGLGKASVALTEAIERTIPGGIMFSVLEVEGAWIEGAKKWSEVAAGKTWATIKPGEF